MSLKQRGRGTTPLDRLRTHYDRDLKCTKCGFADDGGGWKATTTGERVFYRHVCPSCGARRTRTLRLK